MIDGKRVVSHRNLWKCLIPDHFDERFYGLHTVSLWVATPLRLLGMCIIAMQPDRPCVAHILISVGSTAASQSHDQAERLCCVVCCWRGRSSCENSVQTVLENILLGRTRRNKHSVTRKEQASDQSIVRIERDVDCTTTRSEKAKHVKSCLIMQKVTIFKLRTPASWFVEILCWEESEATPNKLATFNERMRSVETSKLVPKVQWYALREKEKERRHL